MELGHIADIALDTSPISGGTTTLHALWMGLPIVALDGERGGDVSTARTLQTLGFNDEVSLDIDGYVSTALRLMNSPDLLAERRQKVRACMLDCVLMDYRNRTAELERAYRFMWLNWLRGDQKTLSVGEELEPLLAAACAKAAA